MKNHITESKLVEYLLGELTASEEDAVREWYRVSEQNRKLFCEVQDKYLQMRWGVRASKIKVDYSAIRPYIKPKRKAFRISNRIIAAVAIPAVAVVAIALVLRFTPFDSGNDIYGVQFPGNLPMLELSDGSVHTINSIETRLIEKDGTELSVMNGEIIYHNENGTQTEAVYNKISVPRGSDRCHLTLGDGSSVWLNADSKLEYPLNFTAGERRVTLTGEAFFDVVKDDAKPFVVESDSQSVTVLGTEFNVSVYPGEDIVTTLVSGAVKVEPTGDIAAVTLVPGEQARYNVGSGDIIAKNVNAEEFIAWKDGILSVDQITFQQAMMRISRRFDVEFDLPEGGLKDRMLKGAMPSYESFETILSIMGKALDVEFKMGKDGRIKVIEN